MDIFTFGMSHGFIEAKLRGYRSTFLKSEHYNHIKNLSTLEEVLHYLQTETDYGEFIDPNQVTISSLKKSLYTKLNEEIVHIETNCQ